MDRSNLTERQQRERAYYDEFSRRSAPSDVSYQLCFDPVLGKEQRPWNSYWHVYRRALDLHAAPGMRLLDFGCGPGDSAMRYAHIGCEVFGLDISPNNVELAVAAATRYGYDHRTDSHVGTAEALDYPDEHFDVVIGIDILHHVEIPRALTECSRVLKKGGVAIFPRVGASSAVRFRSGVAARTLADAEVAHVRSREEQPSRTVGRPEDRIPGSAHHGARTEAYRGGPRNREDPDAIFSRFGIFSRLDRFLLASPRFGPPFLEKVDHSLTRRVAFLGMLGGQVVIELRK
jgi:2-polyprenyl-3-methyl-5-hydroxy-6-metoxy-1,4-benzoquinol methylase